MFEIVTYATHSQGMFDELVKDNKVKVLGWGKKWNGFTDRFVAYLDYIRDKPDDMIIILVDGFDTKINRDPRGAVELFKKRGYRLLFSRSDFDDKFNTLFGTCKDGITINLGLYMGYVKYLRVFFEKMLKQTCKDDQVIANRSCKDFDFIDIDKNYEIFYNKGQQNYRSEVPNDVFFIGYPGGVNNKTLEDHFKKFKNSLFSYQQFSIQPIIITTLLSSMILPRYNFLIVLLGFIHLISVVYLNDTSCMCL